MSETWWELPAIFVGFFIGSWLADIASTWLKKKWGWIE